MHTETFFIIIPFIRDWESLALFTLGLKSETPIIIESSKYRGYFGEPTSA